MSIEKKGIVLSAEKSYANFNEKGELTLSEEARVVLVYEIINLAAKHRVVGFRLRDWYEAGLPEPEDFLGHLVDVPIDLDSLLMHWEDDVGKKQRKVLAVDFDGVIAQYDGWKGSKHIGETIPGAIESLQQLKDEGWWVCMWTTRAPVGVWHHCLDKGIPVDSVNNVPFRPWAKPKVCADVYLDDRGLQFTGDWGSTLEQVRNFKPWWEKSGEPESFEPVVE